MWQSGGCELEDAEKLNPRVFPVELSTDLMPAFINAVESFPGREKFGISGDSPENDLLGPRGGLQASHESLPTDVPADLTAGLSTSEGNYMIGWVWGILMNHTGYPPSTSTIWNIE